MNKISRDSSPQAGVLRSGRAGHGLSKQTAVTHLARRRRACRTGADTASLWIEEPLRFHRARYEHLTRHLHGKFNQTSALLTCMLLLVLVARAAGGEYVSPERWLCGLLSGWFIISMARLALFTCLAAPRSICYAQGRLRISGLGTLHAEQIRHWSFQHGVRISSHARPGVRLQICCRWCGFERHWTMLMEDNPETERLEQVLKAHLPRLSLASGRLPRPRTIQIEAGILSQ